MAFTLYYFPFGGRAELVRLIAGAVGLELREGGDGKDLDRSEFGSPSGLPLLSHLGVKMSQSTAIENYISLWAFPDILPSQRAKDFQLMCIKEDILAGVAGVLFNPAMKDDKGKQKEEIKKVVDKWFPVLENLTPVGGFCNEYAYPTVADLAILNIVECAAPFGIAWEIAEVDIGAAFPKVKALAVRTASAPKVKVHLAASNTFRANPFAEADQHQHLVGLFQKQRDFYNSGATRPIAWRIEQIKKLVMAIQQNAAALSKAQAEDGVIPSDLTGAVGMMMGAMGFYCAKVGEWSAPDILEDTIGERSGGIDADWLTVKEPKGLVLNIAPWNAPVLLSALPMLGALAAGNTCIIKPPEACPKTSQLFAELVAGALSPEAVTVVQGGPKMVGDLIDLGFDHVMFTGGTSIGKIIMARAAKTLTPVTLELGGKNPVMIDEMDDGFLAAAVKEIVGTKMYFSGEFCQCHDYFLVLDSMWDKFTKALGEAVSALGDKRNVRIINKRHFDRCKRMMLEHGGTFLPAAPPVPDAENLRLPVTAVVEPRPGDFIMQDEAFGPVWSVLRVASVDAAVARANASPTGKPLVSYYYGQRAENADKWMNSTSSGCLAVNAGPMRMQSNFHAGIHGVGNSGLGGASIWGKHVFDTFSHHKHVVKPKGGAFAGSIWGSGPYLGKA